MNAGAITMVGAPTGGANPNAPVASFTPASANVYVSSPVQFTDTSTNTPTAWSWTVNGSVFSTAQNPRFTPPSQGVYVIQLTASNSFGSNMDPVPCIVTAHN